MQHRKKFQSYIIVQFSESQNSQKLSETDAILHQQVDKIDTIIYDSHVHHPFQVS